MRLKCTRGVASSVSRLLLCHVPTARPSRTSWSEASLPMWRHPTGARSADSASTAAAKTSDSVIGAPVPNAKARWNPQARKNSGRKSRHNLKIPPHAARGFSAFLEYYGTSPHATRGRDGREEGRECGYYYLHRNLNHPLLHRSPPFVSPCRSRHHPQPCPC